MENIPLLLNDFKMSKNFDVEDILRHPNELETGFVLKVDFYYPNLLHDQHKDFPLRQQKKSPTKICVIGSWTWSQSTGQ